MVLIEFASSSPRDKFICCQSIVTLSVWGEGAGGTGGRGAGGQGAGGQGGRG